MNLLELLMSDCAPRLATEISIALHNFLQGLGLYCLERLLLRKSETVGKEEGAGNKWFVGDTVTVADVYGLCAHRFSPPGNCLVIINFVNMRLCFHLHYIETTGAYPHAIFVRLKPCLM